MPEKRLRFMVENAPQRGRPADKAVVRPSPLVALIRGGQTRSSNSPLRTARRNDRHSCVSYTKYPLSGFFESRSATRPMSRDDTSTHPSPPEKEDLRQGRDADSTSTSDTSYLLFCSSDAKRRR